MPTPELLQRLLTAAGPPGREEAPVEVWRQAAAGFASVSTDVMGTPVARVEGREGGPLLAVIGHIDEIALLVSHITDDGFLRLVTSGGWDPQILVGQRVLVLTRDGPIPGVVGRKPIHLLEEDERKKVVEIKRLHVDIGARDGKEARKLVRVGDPLLIDAEPVELPNGRLTSRSLDNRLGAWVALEAARLVSEAGGAPGPLAAVASVQEEIGGHGALTSAYGLEPDVAIVVDVTHATDSPGVEPDQIGSHPLGSGPVINRGPVLSPRVTDLLCETAETEKIAYTLEPSGRGTFTDADAVHLTRRGVPTALVSFPLRYMHSPIEVVELGDVEAAARLIAAFAQRLTSEVELRRW
ncbi:MAG TPA: M42 family metallopeptidase [Thermoleophilaceae bacterium]|nr:M42 family metallopeptidase [Thermoleophilaceae bacterium]